jgi:presenilin-like A22 family membrane protease
VPVAGVAALPLAASAAVVVALTVYPEWYVVDAAGVIMGAGAAGLFGIGFGTLPALVLLVVLAVYDAVSVYGTEHMLTLAEGVMAMKVPVLLVVPTNRSFSFLDVGEDAGTGSDGADSDGEHGAGSDGPTPGTSTGDGAVAEPEGRAADSTDRTGEGPDDGPDAGEGPLARDALFIGLGDAVIPTVLVASAGFFLDAPTHVPGIALNVPALGAIVGTIAGLIGLLWMVFRGRAHAGLPLLNGGAIAGYLLASLASDVPLDVALGL